MRAALGPEMYAKTIERSRRLVAALEQPIITLEAPGGAGERFGDDDAQRPEGDGERRDGAGDAEMHSSP